MCLFSHALPLQITTNIRCHNNSSDTSLLFHCCVFSPCLLCAVHLRLLSRRTWVPCLFPSLTLSLFQSPQTLGGSDNKRRGEEKGTTVGAFHRHAKSFRGKPSQIFPTVCGKGLCFSCYSVPLRKLTVGESGAHTKTQVLSPNHLLWFTVQSTVSWCSYEWLMVMYVHVLCLFFSPVSGDGGRRAVCLCGRRGAVMICSVTFSGGAHEWISKIRRTQPQILGLSLQSWCHVSVDDESFIGNI